jgi:prepilin-type N-terminal cleavage/methylation domain-containing protein
MTLCPRSPRSVSSGFTLIELLVVIAIIGVLLALLTPALDKAIYRAEMTVCATQLRNIGQGATSYALEYKRFYPDRPIVRAGKQPVTLARYARNGTDDRPVIQNHIPLKLLVDPMTGRINLDAGSSGPNTEVLSPTALWFGWRFWLDQANSTLNSDWGGQGGSTRIGRPFTWDNRRYFIMAGDHDFFAEDLTIPMASHSDLTGTLYNDVRQNDDDVTLSRWVANGTRRGPLDRNFAYDDGSVILFDAVEWEDERMARVPYQAEVSARYHPLWTVQLPIERP